MTGSSKEPDALAQLAGRYLDLWMEHWASSLAAPETGAAMARLFEIFGAQSGLAIEAFTRQRDTGDEPASFRTAHDAGGVRADQLESRIAELEQRLAKLESHAGGNMARPAGKSRKRAGKN